jgi:hypothetical protein
MMIGDDRYHGFHLHPIIVWEPFEGHSQALPCVLIELCREAGGQAAWARRHGFTAAYVNDVIRGRRGKITVPPDILDVLQLEIDYRRKRNG